MMDSDRHKDSAEVYSPDEQGEYTPLEVAPRFSVQGLSGALVDVGEGINETPVEEYTMMLEVMMADHPGQPCPPAFSWNAGMVMHILKSNPVLRKLEHVQVDGLRTAYLFFYDKQGHRSRLTWRRLFQGGSCAPPTLPLVSYLWWRPGGELLLPPIATG